MDKFQTCIQAIAPAAIAIQTIEPAAIAIQTQLIQTDLIYYTMEEKKWRAK